jgi:hypothetical protein
MVLKRLCVILNKALEMLYNLFLKNQELMDAIFITVKLYGKMQPLED